MKEQHVPFDSKNNEPSREEARAKVESYHNELIANQLYMRSLSEKTTSSDEEESQKKDEISAAIEQRQAIRAEYEAFVGPELAAAHDAFEKFSEDDRKEGSNKYDDFKQAEAALAAAEEAFYSKYEAAQSGEKETSLEDDAKDVEQALELFEKGKPIDPEKLQEVLVAAFGETVTKGLTDRMRERLRTEEKLHEVLERMVANNRGAEIEGSPESITLFKGIFDADDLKASLNGSSDGIKSLTAGTSQNGDATPGAGEDGADDDEEDEDDEPMEPITWKKWLSSNARYYASKPWIWLASRNSNYRERYNNASPEERAKMERKANLVGWIGSAAVAAALVATKAYGFEHSAGGSGGTGSGVPGDHPNPNEHPGAGPQLSPEQLFDQSHKTEMDFLNTNGRVHNDFNNIPVDSPNAPERANLFHGFDALQNEYQKSPMELSAQLHQIQTIEMANGHHFDALPQNLQLQPGENPDAYVARLSDAIHHDQGLHDKLTGATMDYLKVHGQPKLLEQNYYSWWIGKDGVAHWEQQSISSSDPNDVIIKLSETKGIRLPCGQPIELIPVTPHVEQPIYHAPVVSHPAPAPAPAPEAPAPIPQPEQPPEVVVPPVTIPPIEIPQPPIPVTPIEGLTPKSTPRSLIPNNHWMGSGESEGDTPKPVQQNHAPAQVPGLKPAHTQAPPEQASRQSSGSATPGHRAPRAQ